MHGYEPPRARFRRRVAEELRLMVERGRSLDDKDCFWVLELNRPNGNRDGVRQATCSRVPSISGVSSPGSGDGDMRLSEPPYPGLEHGNEQGGPPRRNRYVQCLFEAHKPYFVLDLPRCTLDPAEADVLLRERAGFARATERPGLGYSHKTCTEHDPVIRQYLVGEEDEAADDMRYVLFDLFCLPVTTPLYLTAAAFEGCACWFERGEAFDTLSYPRPLGTTGCPSCRDGRTNR